MAGIAIGQSVRKVNSLEEAPASIIGRRVGSLLRKSTSAQEMPKPLTWPARGIFPPGRRKPRSETPRRMIAGAKTCTNAPRRSR